MVMPISAALIMAVTAAQPGWSQVRAAVAPAHRNGQSAALPDVLPALNVSVQPNLLVASELALRFNDLPSLASRPQESLAGLQALADLKPADAAQAARADSARIVLATLAHPERIELVRDALNAAVGASNVAKLESLVRHVRHSALKAPALTQALIDLQQKIAASALELGALGPELDKLYHGSGEGGILHSGGVVPPVAAPAAPQAAKEQARSQFSLLKQQLQDNSLSLERFEKDVLPGIAQSKAELARYYSGETLEAAEVVFQASEEMTALSLSAEQALGQVESLLYPKGFCAWVRSLFSPGRHAQALSLMAGPGIESQVRQLSARLSTMVFSGRTLAASVLESDKAFQERMALLQEASRTHQQALSLDQGDLFAAPSFDAELLAAASAAASKAAAAPQVDPIAASQEAHRLAWRALTTAELALEIRGQRLPRLREASGALSAIGVSVGWVEEELRTLSEAMDKAAESPAEISAGLDGLQSRLEKAIGLAGAGRALAWQEIEAAAGLAQALRGEIAAAIGREAGRIVLEPEVDPEPALQAARDKIEAATALLSKGNLEPAKAELDAAVSVVRQAQGILGDARNTVQQREHSLAVWSSEDKRLQGLLSEYAGMLAGIKRDYSVSVFHSLELKIEEARLKLGQVKPLLEEFDEAFRSALIMKSRTLMRSVQGLYDSVVAYLKAFQEGAARIEAADSQNAHSLQEQEAALRHYEAISDVQLKTLIQKAVEAARSALTAAGLEQHRRPADPFRVSEFLGEARAALDAISKQIADYRTQALYVALASVEGSIYETNDGRDWSSGLVSQKLRDAFYKINAAQSQAVSKGARVAIIRSLAIIEAELRDANYWQSYKSGTVYEVFNKLKRLLAEGISAESRSDGRADALPAPLEALYVALASVEGSLHETTDDKPWSIALIQARLQEVINKLGAAEYQAVSPQAKKALIRARAIAEAEMTDSGSWSNYSSGAAYRVMEKLRLILAEAVEAESRAIANPR